LLHRRARTLGLFHRLDDFSVTGVAADSFSADFQRARLIDRAGEYGRAGKLLHWHRLAHDPRLVDE